MNWLGPMPSDRMWTVAIREPSAFVVSIRSSQLRQTRSAGLETWVSTEQPPRYGSLEKNANRSLLRSAK